MGDMIVVCSVALAVMSVAWACLEVRRAEEQVKRMNWSYTSWFPEKARWRNVYTDEGDGIAVQVGYACDNCSTYSRKKTEYCPNCGRPMEEEDNG